jgi:ribose transport system permease protein
MNAEPAFSRALGPIKTGSAKYGTIIVTIIVIAAIAIHRPDFVSTSELTTLAVTAAPLGLLAMGVTLTLVIGEFDLSFAANMTMGATLCARLLATGPGVGWTVLAVVCTLAACTFVGVLNGFMITRFSMSAFITTLAMSGLLTGVAYGIGGYNSVAVPARFTSWATASLGPIPVMFVILVAAAVIVWFVLEHTYSGRDCYAIGGRLEAARLRGVPVARIRFIVFCAMGLLCGLTALVMASSLGSLDVGTVSGNYLLDGLACAFLGTAVLRPGEVHVVGTSVGLILVTVLVSGMTFINVAYEYQSLVIGLVLIVAVSFARSQRDR